MRIYTRTGDNGETSLLGGSRVKKSDSRINALGTIDELNALLGVAGCHPLPSELRTRLLDIQGQLFALAAELARTGSATPRTSSATPRTSSATPRPNSVSLDGSAIATLENQIDEIEARLTPLKTFILPGGCMGSAALHHARTVCRRAERQLVALSEEHSVSPTSVVYLNRLSDWLFVAARHANHAHGVEDTPWPRRHKT